MNYKLIADSLKKSLIIRKKLLLTAITAIGLATTTTAQTVPSYVPSNGLVGWWPFNGNAHDESGNGNNGAVNGATLTADRFGNTGKAYSFDGVDDWIQVSNLNESSFNGDFTISLWCSFNSFSNDYLHLVYGENGFIVINGNGPSYFGNSLKISAYQGSVFNPSLRRIPYFQTSNTFNTQNIINITLTKINNVAYIYVNGVINASTLVDNNLSLPSGNKLFFGSGFNNATNYCLNGSLDDIGIWNRALTQQEMTNLFNGGICYQNVTVTDTLRINTTITGFNPVTYQNSIKIWPNPTKDHITIDNGNIANLTGHQIKISNALGQQVFQSAINQKQFYVDMSSWGGHGIYFVNIINAQGVTIETKKIVLE